MSTSSSNAPPGKSSVVARMTSYTYIFVAIAVSVWNVVFSATIIPSQTSSLSYDMINPFTNNTSGITKVLIARTVSPSEIQNVIYDIMHVKSFYTGRHEILEENSRANCPTLSEAGYAANLDPYVNGSQFFPNHILCNSKKGTTENNYFTVKVDFMLFARNEVYAQNISQSINMLSQKIEKETLYEVGVDIVDVSLNPKKFWNWILHATDDRLAGYDYVWFMDGDMNLRSLNWQAFWQQVKLMRPKITQPAVIGNGKDKMGTVHGSLRFKSDSRLMAAEIALIEPQSPLLEVKTWLDYRRFLVSDPEPMDLLEQGAENCWDMAWCHSAKNNMNGKQGIGGIHQIAYQEHHSTLSLTEDSNSGAKGRACVVLYQTPIRHISKQTIDTAGRFVIVTTLLCRYFRLKKGVIGKGVFERPYEIFIAPKP